MPVYTQCGCSNDWVYICQIVPNAWILSVPATYWYSNTSLDLVRSVVLTPRDVHYLSCRLRPPNSSLVICSDSHELLPRTSLIMPPTNVIHHQASMSSSRAVHGDITVLQIPDIFTCPFKVNPSNESEYMVHYNAMATLVNPLGEDTISRLFARGVAQEFGYTTLWVLLGWCAVERTFLHSCSC
jgi:hypothetical protein